ncbi:beta-1,3-galactosyltransferase 1-like [Tribolium madens]|uniref:beta-1,3-galactosyltransferase 1-like n=1 Tax=Tribolium madens TaxID=41895 RepID=UPI001CF726A2|nr:beta-1,3-galactosyltransferase 1-like [Tribolium madens]
MNLKKRSLSLLFVIVAVIFIASFYVNNKPQPLPVPKEVEGWGRNVSKNVKDYISETAEPHIMPKKFCNEKRILLVFIHSKFDKFDARKAIRETWGQKRDNVSFYFLVGEDKNRRHEVQLKLKDESEKYNDIIQERFIESYNNLTLKSINMLKLFYLHCLDSYQYLAKIDDDVFLNIANLLEKLKNRNITTNLLLGHIYNSSKPIRDTTSKWYVPYEVYPDDKYPAYLCGATYLMSADVAVKLYHFAFETPIFYIEDIYITGMCSKKANVTLEDNSSFSYYPAKKYVCFNKHNYVYHDFNPKDIIKAQRLLIDKKCPAPGSWLEWVHSLFY